DLRRLPAVAAGLAGTDHSHGNVLRSGQSPVIEHNLPQDASLLVSLMPGDSTRTRGVPFVLFSDGARLANRLDTASGSVPTGGVVNIAMGIPRSCFVDPANPTPREMQHVAVTVLDALCTYLAG
ncbi:MAG: hypothetical protein IJJ14_04890, partial [Coriobacteriales bacterium]|nr:hypothetical protein [Coriobacteriales bacterium]